MPIDPYDIRLGTGGETDITADEAGADDERLRPNPVWAANVHRYALYTALLESGDRVLAPRRGVLHPISGSAVSDRSYLRRLPGEVRSSVADAAGYVDSWVRRRDASAHHPVAAEIIATYVDTVARQYIDRTEVEREIGADIMADVDLRGTPAHDWVMSAYTRGLAYGWGVGMVDSPSDVAEMPSRYHEIAAGLRPWMTWWSPMRIWDLVLGEHGDVVEILIHEARGVWRRWYADHWEVLDEHGHIVAAASHEFGRVPAELFVADDPSGDDELDPPGLSAMRATALVDLQILHHASLLDDVVSKTGYPFYHLQLDAEDAKILADLRLGAGSIFAIEAAGDWKAPPAELTKTLMAYLDWLESRAYKMGGVHRRSMDSVEAHSGLALDWENAPIYATVLRWSRRIQSWETRMWRLLASAMGRDPSAVTVVYPDDLTTRPVDQDLGHARALGEIYAGGMPDWVAVARDALVRRAVTRLVGHLRDVRAAIPRSLTPPPTDGRSQSASGVGSQPAAESGVEGADDGADGGIDG